MAVLLAGDDAAQADGEDGLWVRGVAALIGGLAGVRRGRHPPLVPDEAVALLGLCSPTRWDVRRRQEVTTESKAGRTGLWALRPQR